MSETTYLQTELAKTERSFKIAAIMMTIILVVFVAYFQWMSNALAEVLAPDSVAEFAINEARGALPGLTESLRTNLTGAAPEVVRFVMHQGIDQVLPLASQTFEAHLSEYSHDVDALGAEKAQPAFEAVIHSYKTLPGLVKKEDSAALAEHLSAHVEAHLGSQLDIVAKDGVQARLDSTADTLKHINAELVSMANRPSTDRQGALGKRLITTWWTFVDRGRGQPDSEQPASPASKAKPAAHK